MGSVEMSRALGRYPLPVWCLSLSISWLIAPSTTMAAMVVSHGLRVHSVQDQGHCLWVFVPIHCPWWHMQDELHYCHPFRWCHWPLVWWVPLRTWPLRNSRRRQSALTWLRPRLCSSKLVSTLTTASNLPPLWTGSQKVLSYVFLCCMQLSFVGNLVPIFVASVWLTGQMLALFSLNHIASRKNILCSAVTCKLIQQHVASLKLVSTLTTASSLPQLWTGSQKVLSHHSMTICRILCTFSCIFQVRLERWAFVRLKIRAPLPVRTFG